MAKAPSQTELDRIRYGRWKARTDLGWLCREVIGFKDIHDIYHGPLLNTLQKFPKPTREQFRENDKFENGTWKYKPISSLLELPGKRRRLILESRGHLKTSINIIAHTLQWIINYPDINICIIQAQIEKAEELVTTIKDIFLENKVFRDLFPEHCPPHNIKEWYTKRAFKTEARTKGIIRNESTVMGASIEKGMAGYHFDVLKFTDIVNETNSDTAEMVEKINKRFAISQNLLATPPDLYWMDVEGTRYHVSDVYGKIIDRWMEEKAAGKEPTYLCSTRGCFLKDVEDPKNTPDELALPDKVVDGRKFPVWPRTPDSPKGLTFEFFETVREEDPAIFACQNLNNPMAEESGLVVFRVNEDLPKKIRRQVFQQRIPVVYREIVVDTAHTVSERADYTVITVGAWSRDGKVYIEEIQRGKFTPDETQKRIIETYHRYNTPLRPVRAVKIEQTGYTLGWTDLKRYMDRTGKYLPITMIKRDSRTTKAERIQSTLQPWYVNGNIVFLDDLPAWPALEKELIGFPKYKHDDILDTLADFFQGKEWFGREQPRQATPDEKEEVFHKAFLLKAGVTDPFDTDDYFADPIAAPGSRTGLL